MSTEEEKGEGTEQPIADPSSTEISFVNITEKLREFCQSYSKTPCIWILTPCNQSQMYVHYTISLIKTIEWFREMGIFLKIEFCNNDSLITRARNNLLARAMMDDQATHFMFIDADISWTPQDITRLLVQDKPIIGGIYPKKKYLWNQLNEDNISKMSNHYRDSVLKNVITESEFLKFNMLRYNVNFLSKDLEVSNSLVKVRHVATGFMLIKREVVEEMHERFADTKYADDVGYLQMNENEKAYALFEGGVVDGHYYSEDWMF